MKSKYSLFILILLINSFNCNAKKVKNIELYITPRNVYYGWGDMGLFQFNLNKKSVKRIYSERSYNTLTIKDSVYELYYTKAKIPVKLYINLKTKKNIEIDRKRIMIVISKKDTMFIDNNYNLIRKGRYYQINSEFKMFIEKYMPQEIKENWINDLSGKWSNGTNVFR